jgi:hypothetical protein
MLRLSRAYAAALQASGLQFDMLFGAGLQGHSTGRHGRLCDGGRRDRA